MHSQRNRAVPDMSSAAEAGLSQYDVHTWYGIWVPKGIPDDVQIAAIAALRQAAQVPDTQAVREGQGARFPDVSGAAFGRLVHDEMGCWAQVVKVFGAKLE